MSQTPSPDTAPTAQADATPQNQPSAQEWELPLDLPSVDLRTLLSEMAALKSEVRAETTASRELRTTLQDTLEKFQSPPHSPPMTSEPQGLPKAVHEAATALFETADRLQMALQSAQQLARPQRRWFRMHTDPVAVSLCEGLRLSLQRLHNQLARWEITPIESLHRPFDPNTMEALDTVAQPDLPEAQVVTEITRGYRTPQEVLRFAQVIVNKLTTTKPSLFIEHPKSTKDGEPSTK